MADLGQRGQVIEVVAPGPIHRNRKTIITKFTHKVPNFKEPGATFTLTHDKAPPKGEVDRKREEAAANRLRPGATQQQEPKLPMLLEQRQAAGTGAAAAGTGAGSSQQSFKGVPEGSTNTQAAQGAAADGVSLHYVLFRQGNSNRMVAVPVDQWYAFKPNIDRRAAMDAAQAAGAAAAAAAAGVYRPISGLPGAGLGAGGPKDSFMNRMLPKSLRLERQRQDEEARERQEQVRSGKIFEGGGGLGLGGGPRLRRTVDEEDVDDLFGEGGALDGGDGDDGDDMAPGGGGPPRKKGGRRKGFVTADGEALDGDEEEMGDTYEGEDDNLRPERPKEAEDWEHEDEPADDDQDQGQSEDEVYDDDPGLRKKLGIEEEEEEDEEGGGLSDEAKKLQKLGDGEDEEEEAERDRKEREEEAARKLQLQQQQLDRDREAEEDEEDEDGEEDEDDGEGGNVGSRGGGGYEDDVDDDEDLENDMYTDQAQKRNAPAAAPPAPVPAPAGAGGGTKRGAEAPAAAPTAGAKRARTTASPPAQAPPSDGANPAAATAVARAQPAAGAPAPAAARPAAPPVAAAAPTAGAAAAAPLAGPPVTEEEVVRLLRQNNGRMPFQAFMAHFQYCKVIPELLVQLKRLATKVGHSEKEGNVLLLVLGPKPAAPQ